MSQSESGTSQTLLDPTSERSLAIREPAPRIAELAGKTIGLLDISKPRGDIFLDRIQTRLEDGGAKVNRYAKPTFAKPAPPNLRNEIAVECDAVIEALAD